MTGEQTLKLAKLYSEHTGLKLSSIGAYAANDGRHFLEIEEKGRECLPRTARRVAEWFSENWPQDLAWPQGVPRPSAPKRRRAS